MIRSVLTAVLLLLLLVAESHAGRILDGTVQAVYDGDTVLLTTREGSRVKIRLYGIDAPETAKPDKPGQPSGAAAKRTLGFKVMGRRVTAETVEVDQYQRVIAVLRLDGRDINREMVAEGMAWAYRHYLHGPYASEYIGAEERARGRHIGLWRDPNPQPPWEFRRMLTGGGRSGTNRR
jgi:endonuclease YncB( thermonuclease family)